MKKSRQLNRKTWRLLAKNLIVLVVMVAVAVVGVRSWFTTSASINASGFDIKCEVPAGLEIAIVQPGRTPAASDWKDVSSITLNTTNFSWLSDLNMSQITGDGKTFIAPYLAQEGGIAVIDNTSASWDSDKIETRPNIDYLSFDLYMRTKDSGKKVVYKSDTYCGPVNPNETFANDGTKLNANSVIGAVRVASVGFTNNYSSTTLSNRSLLWIPAPHIYYAYDTIWTPANAPSTTIRNNLLSTSNTYGLPTARDTSTNTLTNYYSSNNYNGTYKHNYWTYTASSNTKTHSYIAYGTNRATQVTANTNQDYQLGSQIDLSALNATQTISGTNYYVNKARINVWIEGEDPEARAAQVAGEFTLSLKFDLVNS